MKLVQPPRSPDPERLHVLAARLRMWVLEICVWLAGLAGRRMPRAFRIMLREDIREALFGVRLLIFALAMLRRERRAFLEGAEHPPSVPRGCRRVRAHTSALRLLKRAVRLRGRTIHARVANLCAMLHDLDRWVKRVLAHLKAGPHGCGLVLCWAVADATRGLTAVAPNCVDTS